jgi:hypothetical protein
MNKTTGHQHMDELLPAAALEMLEGEDLDQVLAHTQECAECGRLLREYRVVAGTIALALPSQPLESGRSARLRRRLLARAGSQPSAATTRARSRWGGADRWAGWAVAAGLAGVLLVHHGFHRPLAYGWIVAGIATVALVAFAIYATVQRRRVAALEERLAELKSD